MQIKLILIWKVLPEDILKQRLKVLRNDLLLLPKDDNQRFNKIQPDLFISGDRAPQIDQTCGIEIFRPK